MTKVAAHPPGAPDDVEGAIERIRESGGRVTSAKREVLGLLFASGPPLTAEEFGDRLEGIDRSIVYRCLGQFEELGIAEHVHLGHGQAVYRRRGLSTIPVACQVCGTAAELDRAEAEAFITRVRRQTGIELDLVHFPLLGRCTTCADA